MAGILELIDKIRIERHNSYYSAPIRLPLRTVLLCLSLWDVIYERFAHFFSNILHL